MANTSLNVISADDETALELAPPGAVTYGRSAAARYRMSSLQSARSSISFSLTDTVSRPDPAGGGAGNGATDLGSFEVAVPGEYNARNATAAIAVAVSVGVDPDDARRALARFGGVARRFEFRGERDGVTFVDDYAHLPSEVRAGLGAARSGGYGRVVCVFQPHRYSRIASLAPDFSSAFVDCDVLFVTDIYPAGEEARPGVTGQLIVDAVLAAHPGANVTYAPTHEELLARLRETLRVGDCCITLEAGDLTALPDEMLAGDRW
jgi:UDP-N-acetylmuramate--alanine ligase